MREFKIGQYVLYVPRRAEGRYVVMRLLPQPNGEVRYRIRSEDTPSREYTAKVIPAACCARAASGHATVAPPISAMNCRRLMGFRRAELQASTVRVPHLRTNTAACLTVKITAHVRLGSLADISGPCGLVGFAPDIDQKGRWMR
jgi:hypothetical protein